MAAIEANRSPKNLVRGLRVEALWGSNHRHIRPRDRIFERCARFRSPARCVFERSQRLLSASEPCRDRKVLLWFCVGLDEYGTYQRQRVVSFKSHRKGRLTMIPWRNVGVIGFVATCLFAGCTVTTSDGNADGGFASETGGASFVGSTGGNSAGGASAVIECNPGAEVQGSCGQCIQTPDNTDGTGGLCNEYKVCAAVAGCTAIINAMANCMALKAQANGDIVSQTADAECRASTPGMMTTDTDAASQAAQTFWDQIQVNSHFTCTNECWAA